MNNRKRVIYIGILFIITVMVSITAFSYAYLTRVDEQHGKLNMTVGTLDYKIESDDLNNNSITLGANESKEIELIIKSLNQIDSKYKLYTNSVENVTIGYLDETGFDESTGTISANGTVKVKIVLENDSDTSKTITFGVQGGFDYNDVTLNTGRIEVEEGQALCPVGLAYEFDYTGDVQEFTAKCPGVYKVELWGASGGAISSYLGGEGGYTQGNIGLLMNNKLYLYIGGQGSNTTTGGYNGGGSLTDGQNAYGSSGGGSTDIRLIDGEWNNFDGLKSRIMVAAGGGGANNRADNYGTGNGGPGGGLIGYAGQSINHNNGYGYGVNSGGTQTAGGTSTWHIGTNDSTDYIKDSKGFFGYTSVPNSAPAFAQSGAGNGYYGGAAGTHAGAAGGSSFISGYNGCNAISESSTKSNIIHTNQPNHYSGKVFTDAVMIDGKGCDWSTGTATNCGANQPQPDGTIATGHSGNGYARITYLGKKYTITFNANNGTVSENTRDVFENNIIGTLPIPTRNNYVFKGWYLENTFNTLVDENYVVSGDITLYARWDAILVVNRDILNQGTFRNVTPTYLTNQVDGTDGFTIVGRPSQNTNARCNNVPYYQWNTWLRWDYEIDLTNYSTIKVSCRKNADHGACLVYITDGISNAPDCDGSTTVYATSKMGYDRLSVGTWQEFEIDVSEITGTHVLSLIGGYQDASGNTSSSTSYSNIRFIP